MTAYDAADKTLNEILSQSRFGMKGADALALGQALATLAVAEAVREGADFIAAAIDRSDSRG